MSHRAALLSVLGVLVLLNAVVWVAIWAPVPKKLMVFFLAVGQGDAIYIESPTGVQVLIDGGRDRSVLRELPHHMGPLDRSIDVVIATHPDADHISGLPAVFEHYDVNAYFTSGVTHDTGVVEELAASVSREQGNMQFFARRGQRIDIGGGAYLDILFPDRDVTHLETNTASIVARLTYGATSFMLTGDAPSGIEDWLVSLDGATLESDVLKAGHHGSRTSTDELWLATVRPGAVVISAGEGNSYGHPHEEVVERIEVTGAQMLTTFEGAVTFQSDGQTVMLKE